MEYLKDQLRNGFWPRYCLEDVEWQGFPDYEYLAFPMLSFCDIPIGRLSEHVNFYGRYGIGLTKAWGAQNGLNPLLYFAGNNSLHQALIGAANAVGANQDATIKSSGSKCLRHLLSYLKPISGRMIVGGQPVLKEFYQESEWRYVPQSADIKDHLKFDDFSDASQLEKWNLATHTHCRLKFLPSDVRYVFVPMDTDIPPIMNFIQTEMDNHPSAELKVLMSRVTSLESLSTDV